MHVRAPILFSLMTKQCHLYIIIYMYCVHDYYCVYCVIPMHVVYRWTKHGPACFTGLQLLNRCHYCFCVWLARNNCWRGVNCLQIKGDEEGRRLLRAVRPSIQTSKLYGSSVYNTHTSSLSSQVVFPTWTIL